MPPDSQTHIALCFDDAFWAPTYVTMRSACLSTPHPEQLVFHLCRPDISDHHRADLELINEEFGAMLVDHRLDADPVITEFFNNLPTHHKYPPIVYARLFLDSLLPTDIERIVYLDTDVMVRRPLEKLANIDLEGNGIAAASDPGRLRRANGRDMRETERPFFHAARYFNAGVLVFDRPSLIKADLPSLLRRHIDDGSIRNMFQDQDLLNLAFADNWLELDVRWNLTKPHPALRALDPWIVHYTTENKPWNTLTFAAFASTYRDVMTSELFRRYRRYRWRRRVAKLCRKLKLKTG